MTTVEAPRRGRPTHDETLATARAKEAERAAQSNHRRRFTKEDVVEAPSPVKDPRGLNAIQRARYFAIKAAIITPGIERCAEYQGGRVSYVVKDRLLHQTNAMKRPPPYRPCNRTLEWYSLTEAQITAAFGACNQR